MLDVLSGEFVSIPFLMRTGFAFVCANAPIQLLKPANNGKEKIRYLSESSLSFFVCIVLFRLCRSDIIATVIVILKPYGFSDILFASKTREANITRRTESPQNRGFCGADKANRTGVILRLEYHAKQTVCFLFCFGCGDIGNKPLK